MKLDPRDPRGDGAARLAVILLALLITVGHGAAAYTTASEFVSPVVRLAYAAFAGLAVACVVCLRKNFDRRLATTLFVVLVLPSYAIVWIYHETAVTSGSPWTPFPAYGLRFLVLSVLIPGPYWVNALLIAAYLFEALVVWTVLDIPHAASAASEETTLLMSLYLLAAVLLWAFRIVHDRMALKLEQSRIKSETLEHTIRVMLSLRDRTNTPLQTLNLAADLLRSGHPPESLPDIILRATKRIEKTSLLVSRLDSKLVWPRAGLMTDDELAASVGIEEAASSGPTR